MVPAFKRLKIREMISKACQRDLSSGGHRTRLRESGVIERKPQEADVIMWQIVQLNLTHV